LIKLSCYRSTSRRCSEWPRAETREEGPRNPYQNWWIAVEKVVHVN